MKTVRPATDAEKLSITVNHELDTYVAVLDDDGEIKGQIALSFALGQAFGHDTKCWSDDPRDATRLWFHARTYLREKGYSTVNVHIEPDDESIGMMDFWRRLGFEPTALVMRGEV